MSKIIITSPFSNNGGVAQFIKNLSSFFDNEILIFKRGKRKSFEKFGFIYPIIDIFRYINLVLKIRPNKIVINSSLANVGIIRDGIFIRISKALGIKTVLFIHGFNDRALSLKPLIKLGYFKADVIFVLSSKFKIQLEKIGCSKPIKVTYNPINMDLIKGINKKVNERQKKKPIKILMMSRIEKSKGIFIGLEVLKNMQKNNIEFHIAGVGSELENAKKNVKENSLKNIYFHDYVSGIEKVSLLENCDILLFPTFHNEGLPINILEGLAMGLCVISRPIAGIVDLKNHYHIYLVDSLNPGDYQNIIIELLQKGLPKRDILNNQLKAQNDFSPKTIFETVVLLS